MKFKQLNWLPSGNNSYYAETPALHIKYIYIGYEQGLYWASWDMSIPGYNNLEELKQLGQQFHEDYLKQFFE
jgi:hypothetical protein